MGLDLLNIRLREGPWGTWTPSLCVWKGQAGDTEASPGPGQLEAELGLEPCPGSEAPRSPLRMSQG